MITNRNGTERSGHVVRNDFERMLLWMIRGDGGLEPVTAELLRQNRLQAA